MDKLHLSHTQIMTYTDCPAHYLFSYVCGIKAPPRAVMIQGRSIHKGLASGYEFKKENHKEPRIADMLDIYEDDFKQELAKGEVIFKKDEKPEHYIDTGTKGLRLYHSELMPKLKPVEIEKEFNIEFSNFDFKFKGIIDLIDDKGIVHDHKTTGKTPSKLQIDTDQQLSAYSAGYEKITGKKSKGLQLDFLVLLKDPKIVSFKTTRNDDDVRRFLSNLAYVKKAIDAGLFYCVHKSQSWVCSKEWCAYEEMGYHSELYKLGVQKFIDKYGAGGNAEILYG